MIARRVADRAVRRGLAPAAARRAALAAALPFLTGACFATRNDVRVLQLDIASARAEAARADSAQAAQLDRVAGQLRTAQDSLRAASSRANRFEGDARDNLRAIREQLITVQELTGQSQRVIQGLRASLEDRVGAPPSAAPVPGDTSAAAGPGPNRLYEIAYEQYRRGSFGTARTGFNDLLTRFPTHDLAPDALFYVAESFASERNAAAADSTYQAVLTRYPQSPRAATALYKRAQARQAAGRRTEARPMFEELVRRFPTSDEAELAREALRETARPTSSSTRARP